MAQKYIMKRASGLYLYEEKDCPECDNKHVIETNMIHSKSENVFNKYVTQGYLPINSFKQLDDLTKGCSGSEDEDEDEE